MVETGFSPVLPLLLLVLLLAAAAAGMDRAFRTRDGESIFWAGLTAFLAVLLTAAWAVAATPAGSAAVGVVVVAGSIAAAFWLAGRDRRRRRQRKSLQLEAALAAAVTRHRDVLARWSAYELDPWLAAEHPELLDVRAPETRKLIRAMKAAEQLRPETASAPEETAAYAEAVTTLEDALRRAEEAARGGRAA